MTISERMNDPIAVHRLMLLIRRFEERVERMVNDGEIPGSVHLYIGQEAVATGVVTALQEGDVITSTHRGHGHLLAMGVEPKLMLAELCGKTEGLNRAHAGSMHMADLSRGIYGANGIVGAGTPWAVGASWAFKARDESRIAVSFVGDGALNQGVFLESLNLAAIWELPVVMVCENNGFAVSTGAGDVTSGTIADRAKGFGLEFRSVDGMRVDAVTAAMVELAEHARTGRGPALLECRTYRFRGHHIGEELMKLTYRSPEDLASWMDRDPLLAWAKAGDLGPDVLERIEAEVSGVIEDATEFARHGTSPKPEDALKHAYADADFAGFPAEGS